MLKRKLGNQGLEVSEIGLGCMTMTGGYGQSPDRATSLAASWSIPSKIRYSASDSRRFRTLSFGLRMPWAGLLSMIPASTA